MSINGARITPAIWHKRKLLETVVGVATIALLGLWLASGMLPHLNSQAQQPTETVPVPEYKTDQIQLDLYIASDNYGKNVSMAKTLVDSFRNADHRFFSLERWSATEKSEYAQLMSIYLGEEELLARACREFEARGTELKNSGGQPMVLRPKACETAKH